MGAGASVFSSNDKASKKNKKGGKPKRDKAEAKADEKRSKSKFGYSGEYDSRGKKDGHGVFIYESGDRYEGEWKFNKKNGYGKYYFSNGDIYDGEFKAGTKHGKGLYLYSSGEVYDGFYANNQMDGVGTYKYKDGAQYTGEFKCNAKHGKGVYTYSDGAIHDGIWHFGEARGHGKYTFPNGDIYEGPFLAGTMHGTGIIILNSYQPSSSSSSGGPPRMEGQFHHGKLIATKSLTQSHKLLQPQGHALNNGANVKLGLSQVQSAEKSIFPHPGYSGPLNELGQKHGRGVFQYDNGDCYDGDWINNRKDGHGRYQFANGDVYEGAFVNGLKHGHGRYYYTNGDIYDGQFQEGYIKGCISLIFSAYRLKFLISFDCVSGEGILRTRNGKYFKGQFESGLPHGFCELRDYYWDKEENQDPKSEGEAREEMKMGGEILGREIDQNKVTAIHSDPRVGTLRYSGPWKGGKPHGDDALHISPNGDEYRGAFREGKMHGKGIYRFARGQHFLSFNGDFKEGMFHGQVQSIPFFC